MTHDSKKLNRRITQSLLIEVPESPQFQGNHLAMTRMQEVYLVDLEGPNPYCHDLNARYMDTTLIRLIVPAPQGHVNIYHKKDRNPFSSAFTRAASIPINISMLGSEPVAFGYNATEVSVNYFNFVATSCSGNLCMNTNSSNLAIQHQVDIMTSDGVKSMPNFSSMKFSLLYLSHMLPGAVKVGTFHSIKFINDNGGFTVQGWLKRGIINDRSLLGLESSGGE
eukprot:15365174-Ditylum_brightwellii.AAC.1